MCVESAGFSECDLRTQKQSPVLLIFRFFEGKYLVGDFDPFQKY